MINNLKKLLVLAFSLSLVACAGDGGGNALPQGKGGNLPQAAATNVILGKLVGGTGAMNNLFTAPTGTNLNQLGLKLPAGYDDPSAKNRALAGDYDHCITEVTAPYKKYIMNCNNINIGGTFFTYKGTIEFIKNDIATKEFHYRFDYVYSYGDGSSIHKYEYKGEYQSSVSGTVTTTISEFFVREIDNRPLPGCVNNQCDIDFTHSFNWEFAHDSSDDATNIKGFVATKGKFNSTTDGWDGSIDVSFEIEVEDFIVTAGGIQSGTMRLIDAANTMEIVWAANAITSFSYNGISLTVP